MEPEEEIKKVVVVFIIQELGKLVAGKMGKKLQKLVEDFSNEYADEKETIAEMLQAAADTLPRKSARPKLDPESFNPSEFRTRLGVRQNLLQPTALLNAVKLMWGYAVAKEHIKDDWAGIRANPRAHIILAIISMTANIFRTQNLAGKEKRLGMLGVFVNLVLKEQDFYTSLGQGPDTFFGQLTNLLSAIKRAQTEVTIQKIREGVQENLKTAILETQQIDEVMYPALGEFYYEPANVRIATATAGPRHLKESDTFISTLMDAIGVKILSEEELKAGECLDQVLPTTKHFMEIIIAWGNKNISADTKMDESSLMPIISPMVAGKIDVYAKADFLDCLYRLAKRKLTDQPNFPRLQITNPTLFASQIQLVTADVSKEIKLSGINKKFLTIASGDIEAHQQMILLYIIEKARLIYSIGRLTNLFHRACEFYTTHGKIISALFLSDLFYAISPLIISAKNCHRRITDFSERLQSVSKAIAPEISKNISVVKSLGGSIEQMEEAIKSAISNNDAVLKQKADGEISIENSLREVLYALVNCATIFKDCGLLIENEHESVGFHWQKMESQLEAAKLMDQGMKQLAQQVREHGVVTREAVIKAGKAMLDVPSAVGPDKSASVGLPRDAKKQRAHNGNLFQQSPIDKNKQIADAESVQALSNLKSGLSAVVLDEKSQNTDTHLNQIAKLKTTEQMHDFLCAFWKELQKRFNDPIKQQVECEKIKIYFLKYHQMFLEVYDKIYDETDGNQKKVRECLSKVISGSDCLGGAESQIRWRILGLKTKLMSLNFPEKVASMSIN